MPHAICLFIDGPAAGELKLSPMACRDTVRVQSEVWFGDLASGSTGMYASGPVGKNWIMQSVHEYEKLDREPGEQIRYRFVRTLDLHRCAKRLATGRRCKNATLEFDDLCEVHQRIADRELK